MQHQHHHASSEAPRSNHATAHGRDRHAGHSVAMFRDKFWLSLLLTLPTVIWSADVQHWLSYTAPKFPGSEFVAAIFGTAVFLYGGVVFLRGAKAELAERQPGMMTLISLAIIVAFGTSLAATFGVFPGDVWWELSTLVTIMVLGHWLEMRAITQARGALNALAELLPATGERVTAEKSESVPLSELRVGDVVLVRPGGRVPVDGTVIEGGADADESMITGESKTVSKSAGSRVIAGTIISSGSLKITTTATGEQTALSGIMRLVAAAQASASRTQALADRAAALLFYIALVAAAITFSYWYLAGDPAHALLRTATVLIIACPHALGLAIPLVIAISTSLGAQHGLLVKDRLALEQARSLDVVIFDKTGTLTRGKPALSDIATEPGVSESELLAFAAAVETNSEHPIAKAVLEASQKRKVTVPKASEFKAAAGMGANAVVNGKPIAVGGPRLLAQAQINASTQLAQRTERWAADGKTVLYVLAERRMLGAFSVEDEIRAESKEAIDQLHRLGIRVAIVTGDARSVAESVGNRLGVDDIAAEVLPKDKAAAVERFLAGGKKVAMVGDGVNDAPALAAATVGIAIGAGTDVAVESAGIVLVRNDPRDVISAIKLSRASYRKMVQNLVWATGYNVVAIPIAAGLLVKYGVDLPMSIGAMAMSLSTIIVAANAQLLRRLRFA